jgi:hypothetical protein
MSREMQNGWAGQASREKGGDLGAAFGRNLVRDRLFIAQG